MKPDAVRDIVIETFADRAAELLEQIVELTIERDAHQLLARQAIHMLHTQYCELSKLREQHRRLHDEYRDFRAHTMRRDTAKAA